MYEAVDFKKFREDIKLLPITEKMDKFDNIFRKLKENLSSKKEDLRVKKALRAYFMKTVEEDICDIQKNIQEFKESFESEFSELLETHNMRPDEYYDFNFSSYTYIAR